MINRRFFIRSVAGVLSSVCLFPTKIFAVNNTVLQDFKQDAAYLASIVNEILDTPMYDPSPGIDAYTIGDHEALIPVNLLQQVGREKLAVAFPNIKFGITVSPTSDPKFKRSFHDNRDTGWIVLYFPANFRTRYSRAEMTEMVRYMFENHDTFHSMVCTRAGEYLKWKYFRVKPDWMTANA